MGGAKEHLRKFSELSEKIAALGESLRQAEKDMESTWTDQIEMRGLRDVKRGLKEVEDASQYDARGGRSHRIEPL
jgi:hypothetical protein